LVNTWYPKTINAKVVFGLDEHGTFLASLIEFDQVLLEDDSAYRMSISRIFWRNCKYQVACFKPNCVDFHNTWFTWWEDDVSDQMLIWVDWIWKNHSGQLLFKGVSSACFGGHWKTNILNFTLWTPQT